MKKHRILTTIGVIGLIFAATIIGILVTESIQEHRAEAKASQVISQVVPKAKQIVIKTEAYPLAGPELFPQTYEVKMTTQKDYDHWRKLVLARKQPLASDEQPKDLKAYVEDMKNCEITYSSIQTRDNTAPDKTKLDMLAGNVYFTLYPDKRTPYANKTGNAKTWVGALQAMQDNFAYRPTNQALVAKWGFPASLFK